MLAAALLASAPAHGQKRVDLAAFKCKEFLVSKKETVGLILMWLEGYYSEADASPIVDFEKMRDDDNKLTAYCGKNPGASLIVAAEEVMGK